MSMFRPACRHLERYTAREGDMLFTRCVDCDQVMHITDVPLSRQRGWSPIRDMRPHVEAYRRLRTAWHVRGWK